MERFDVAVVGGGIVGISVAHALSGTYTGLKVVLFEKEAQLAGHQTGRNSGVIHSGVYYKPGSLKAELATKASATMVAFCEANGISHEVCGKLIVASNAEQEAKLGDLAERGRANGIATRLLSSTEAADYEPHLRCRGAIHVPTAGIVDYGQVAQTLAAQATSQGVEIRTSAEVTSVGRHGIGWRLEVAGKGVTEARLLVNLSLIHI